VANNDYYPDLKHVDHKVDQAIKLALQNTYKLRDMLTKTQKQVDQQSDPIAIEKVLSAIPGYSLLQTGDSRSLAQIQGSIPPDISGTFSNTTTANSINWIWTNLQDYPAHLWDDLQRFVTVPDGSAQATGLAPSTTYYFYPYFDLLSGFVIFAFDPSLIVGAGPANAHSAPSIVAAQEANGDNHKPLSIGAMQGVTPASGTGGGGGFGGGGCGRTDMFARFYKSKELVRLGDLKKGDRIEDLGETVTEVTHVEIRKAKYWVDVECSNGDGMITTPSHAYPLIDVPTFAAAEDLRLSDVMVGKNGSPLRIQHLRPHEAEWEFAAISTLSHTFLAGKRMASILNHNVQKK